MSDAAHKPCTWRTRKQTARQAFIISTEQNMINLRALRLLMRVAVTGREGAAQDRVALKKAAVLLAAEAKLNSLDGPLATLAILRSTKVTAWSSHRLSILGGKPSAPAVLTRERTSCIDLGEQSKRNKASSTRLSKAKSKETEQSTKHLTEAKQSKKHLPRSEQSLCGPIGHGGCAR